MIIKKYFSLFKCLVVLAQIFLLNLPANRKNFWVSVGKSDVTDDTDCCLLGLTGPGERGPGDAGGNISVVLVVDRRWLTSSPAEGAGWGTVLSDP